MAREDFTALAVMDMIAPSHDVASEAHFKEEDAMCVITADNLEYLIKTLTDASPGPPPGQSIETRTAAIWPLFI